jgi:hypothetical protein
MLFQHLTIIWNDILKTLFISEWYLHISVHFFTQSSDPFLCKLAFHHHFAHFVSFRVLIIQIPFIDASFLLQKDLLRLLLHCKFFLG